MLSRILCAIAAACLIAGAAQAADVMMIHHEVANYAKWRPIFDADTSAQQAAGLSDPRVYRSVDDPNDVTVVFAMADPAKAKAFAAAKRLKDVMGNAGVKGKPVVQFLEQAP